MLNLCTFRVLLHRKMKRLKHFSKASVTDVPKPDKPGSGKDHKVHLPNTVKGKELQQ